MQRTHIADQIKKMRFALRQRGKAGGAAGVCNRIEKSVLPPFYTALNDELQNDAFSEGACTAAVILAGDIISAAASLARPGDPEQRQLLAKDMIGSVSWIVEKKLAQLASGTKVQ